MRKELAGNPYSSMALAKGAAEAVRPYQYLRPIIMGMTFCECFLMSMRSVQRGLN